MNIPHANDDFYKDKVLEYATNLMNSNLAKRGISNQEIEKVYVIYARRSTKGKDKQERSVADQIAECKEFAERNNLKVYGILEEKETAHKSDMRSVFSEILSTIREGKLYNSILSWHPDRLARNMKDAGVIIDMLDEGIIADLKFSSYTFVNDPSGKMALGIQFVLAKNYSDGISVNTKRGSDRTVAEGKAMGKPKYGYIIQDKFYRPDDNSFSLFKKSWDMLPEGKTLGMVNEYLINSGFRKLPHSSLSRIFADPFYAGIYIHGDNIIDLKSIDKKFEPMISFQDFICVRYAIDGRKGFNPTLEIKNTLFKRMIKCGHCDHYMTPYKAKSHTGERYYYLKCMNEYCILNKNRSIHSSIRGKVIMDYMVNLLTSKLDINEQVYNEAKEKYLSTRDNQIDLLNSSYRMVSTKINTIENRMNGLAESLKSEGSKENEAITNQIKKAGEEIYELNIEKENLSEQKVKLESQINDNVPSYKNFLNFFENIEQTIKSTTDIYLIDQLVRNVFLNLTVKGQKVIAYELNEPFKTYQKLGVFNMG